MARFKKAGNCRLVYLALLHFSVIGPVDHDLREWYLYTDFIKEYAVRFDRLHIW